MRLCFRDFSFDCSAFRIPYLRQAYNGFGASDLWFLSRQFRSVVLPPLKDLKKRLWWACHRFGQPLWGYTPDPKWAAVYFSVATIFIAHAWIAFLIRTFLYCLLLTWLVKQRLQFQVGALLFCWRCASARPTGGCAILMAVDFVNAGRTRPSIPRSPSRRGVIEKTEGNSDSESSKLVVQGS